MIELSFRHGRHGLGRLSAVILLALVHTGCAFLPKTPQVPMVKSSLTENPKSPCAVVLLHGRFGNADDFRRAGFHTEVEQRGLNMELIAVEAHLGYYKERVISERLHEDVVRPLLAEGKQVWLVGVSMGGLGSLIHFRKHAEEISGLAAIAPFLGEAELTSEIRLAGGAESWASGRVLEEGSGSFPELWVWLARNRPRMAEKLRLGFGLDDRFAPANELLAELLPEAQVITDPGGHDWSVWRRIWVELLDRDLICPAASPRSR